MRLISCRSPSGKKRRSLPASFSIEKGETFSLIGESGCGKSTLLRVLAGLQREWRGSIALLGETLPPGRRFEGKLRRNVQMVFQDPWASLHPNHTVARTLSEPLNLHGETQLLKRWRMRCSRWGLSADAGKRYPHQLSGGQRQRVAIARALLLRRSFCCWMNRPRRWICRCRQKFRYLLNRLKAEHEMTYLLVSHDADVIAHMSDPGGVYGARGDLMVFDRAAMLRGEHEWVKRCGGERRTGFQPAG